MWRKLALVPLLLIPVASVAFLIQQGFIKTDWLKKPETAGPPPTVETFKIDSAQTGKSYDISVQLPPSYKDGSATYPVVFAIDDRPNLLDYQKVIDPLVLKSKIREVIVVGVSPARGSKPAAAAEAAPAAPASGGGLLGGGRSRGPRLSDSWLEDTTRTPQKFGDQKPTGGRAEAFVAFFEKELIPKIEGQYRTLPAERSIAGHDFGAVFVVETGLTHPELFAKYLAIAPISEFAESAPIKLAQEKIASDFDPKARMYFVMGADDAPAHMTSFQRLVEVMKSKKFANLEFRSEILPNQDHGRIVVPGAQSGLTFLYGK